MKALIIYGTGMDNTDTLETQLLSLESVSKELESTFDQKLFLESWVESPGRQPGDYYEVEVDHEDGAYMAAVVVVVPE